MTTDTQLQLALAKMLPEKIYFDSSFSVKDCEPRPRWRYDSTIHFNRQDLAILPTEWERVIWLVEDTFDAEQMNDYINYLMNQTHSIFDREHLVHASWQQRARAILKVKGVV